MPSFLVPRRSVQNDIDSLDSYIQKKGKGWIELKNLRRFMQEQYRKYSVNYSDPKSLHLPRSMQRYAALLSWLYESKNTSFAYVKNMRANGKRLGCCPYCGLPGNMTLDHYLPKLEKGFPQFSVFSFNLVPACTDCQNVKSIFYAKKIYPGRKVNAHVFRMKNSNRILHPYFDQFLKNSVLEFTFTNKSSANITAKLICKQHERRLIEFHLRKLKIDSRTKTPIDRFQSALISDLRSLVLKNRSTALKRVKTLVDSAVARAGGATNSIEATYLRSLIFQTDILDQLVNDAKIPMPGLLLKYSSI